jgi:hypothetical protein
VRDQKPRNLGLGFNETDSSKLRPFAKLDYIRRRFPNYLWWDYPENPDLLAAFDAVRQSAGWNSFVSALVMCDDAVNALLEEDITDWSNAPSKIRPITTARNAWRRAATYGIQPPELPVGSASFTDRGLRFKIFALDRKSGVLVARSQRNQVLGMFDLRLGGGGGQHIVSHMLENALRYPDLYLSYPWDIVMATDTIHVPDIDIWIDRLRGEAKLTSPGSPGISEARK